MYNFTFREWSNYTEGRDTKIREDMAIVRFQTALLIQPHCSKSISIKELWPFQWETEEGSKRNEKIDTELYTQIKAATKDW